MNTPNSHTRLAYVDDTLTIDGVTLDFYPAPHGAGRWTPADGVFEIAGISEADRFDFRQRHGMTNSVGGFEIVWDHTRLAHSQAVALLSRHAVSAVLANAVRPLEPTTIEAIDAAMAGGKSA